MNDRYRISTARERWKELREESEKNVKLQAYKQRKNDLAFNFVPVEACSGDLEGVAG